MCKLACSQLHRWDTEEVQLPMGTMARRRAGARVCGTLSSEKTPSRGASRPWIETSQGRCSFGSTRWVESWWREGWGPPSPNGADPWKRALDPSWCRDSGKRPLTHARTVSYRGVANKVLAAVGAHAFIWVSTRSPSNLMSKLHSVNPHATCPLLGLSLSARTIDFKELKQYLFKTVSWFSCKRGGVEHGCGLAFLGRKAVIRGNESLRRRMGMPWADGKAQGATTRSFWFLSVHTMLKFWRALLAAWAGVLRL